MPGVVGTGNSAVSNVLSTPVELRKSDRLERLWGTRKRDEDQRGEFLRGDDFSCKTDLPAEGLGGPRPPSWDVFKAVGMTAVRLVHAVHSLGGLEELFSAQGKACAPPGRLKPGAAGSACAVRVHLRGLGVHR